MRKTGEIIQAGNQSWKKLYIAAWNSSVNRFPLQIRFAAAFETSVIRKKTQMT